MQKEKKIRTYTRKTKTGKTVTVKAHTAKYDAAEEAHKAFAKKKGSGEEFLENKNKDELFGVDLSGLTKEEFEDFADGFIDLDNNGNEVQAPSTRSGFKKFMLKHYGNDRTAQANFRESFEEYCQDELGCSPKELKLRKKEVTPSEKLKSVSTKSKKSTGSKGTVLGFSAEDYKAWYHWDTEGDPKNASALKVKKALIAEMGRSAYNKYEQQMTDSYSTRGHLKGFKSLDTAEREKGIKEVAELARNDEKRDKEEYKAMRLTPKEKSATKGSVPKEMTAKDVHKMTHLNQYDEGEELTGAQKTAAVKALMSAGYKKVKGDFLVPPKGKGPLYFTGNSLAQAGRDEERDLYSGHYSLKPDEVKTMRELGYFTKQEAEKYRLSKKDMPGNGSKGPAMPKESPKRGKKLISDADLKYLEMQATYARQRVKEGRGRQSDREVLAAFDSVNHPGPKYATQLTAKVLRGGNNKPKKR